MILVGAIALVLVLIGVAIGVNIGKSKKYKPVPVTGQGYTWTLQPGAEAQMIYTNFWQFAKASNVLVGDIPNCEFYKIVKEVPRNDFQTDNFYMEDGDSTIMAYHAGDGSRLSELAVDVSSYQAELDWDALLMLTRDEQEEIMYNLFAPQGDLKFTRGRISMNCNVYGRSWYSCDEVQGDLELRYFNIERDKRSIIPLIRAAQKYNSADRKSVV